MKRSKDLEKILTMVECNPNLILEVIPDKGIVVVNDMGKMRPIYLSLKEFRLVKSEIKKEISTRPNPEMRAEHWECLDVNGCYSYQINKKLLDMRKDAKPAAKKAINKRSLKKLCEKYKIPQYMGELFLNEIKLDRSHENRYIIDDAKRLGLMD